MSRKTDLRVLRTRQLLQDALLDLIEVKPFESIQVKEIAEEAMVNRATFYLHYRDKYDLLIQSLADRVEVALSHIVVPQPVPNPITKTYFRDLILIVVRHFAAERRFYRLLLVESRLGITSEALETYIEAATLPWFRTLAKDPDGHAVDMALKFASSACVGVLKWWISNDQPMPEGALADHLVNLLVPALLDQFGVEWEA
ncbi:MAG: TetR family transcriptional regulator [Chloroflexi bacterium]|nr:TetR family transcriptional regulator [Chloroflexota bacterium]